MSDDVIITFDSPADVWRVRRRDISIEISVEEMTAEYYRWQREGGQGEWRVHAEAFCRQRLKEHGTAKREPA